VAFAGVTAGVLQAAKDFRDFRQQVAAVDTIADSSKEKVEQLATGVRELAKAMGVDAVKSTRALYEILSSGIPADNSLFVLGEATKAAIAGLTDVDTAARVGVAVLNGYGLQVSQLSHVYDVLFQTVKDGIVTFEELAKNIGQVIPAARAAHVPIEELGAAFVVLTRQGIDAPEAATAINRAIVDLAAPAPEARENLRGLGIEVKGLFGTIEQLASKQLTFQQLQQLVPDVRATRAVLALANNFKLLSEQIRITNSEAGQTQAAYLKMADTPQQKLERFNSAINDLRISIGEFVTNSSAGFVKGLADMVNAFNALDPKTRNAAIQFTAIAAGATAFIAVARLLVIPLNLLAGALASVGAAGTTAAEGLTGIAVAATGVRLAIAGFLGFKLGEQLYDNFAPVRRIGDLLGIVAGTIDNLVRNGFVRLIAAFTGNKAAADAATAAYQRNRDILQNQFNETVSGSTERLRSLNAEHDRLVAQLAKVSAAAADAANKVDASISRIAANINAEVTAADTFVARFEAQLQSLTASLQQSLGQIQAASASQLSDVAAKTKAALAQAEILATQRKNETADILAQIEIQRTAAGERLAILQKFAKDSISAFNSEAASRLEIATRTGENLKKVEIDISIARVAALQKVVDAFRGHVDELVSMQKGHLQKVKELDEQRVTINNDIESKIRAARRESLSVYEQYADRVREIDTLLSKARLALLAGDTKHAEEFANKAIGLTDQIGKAVTAGERTVVSSFEASTTAVRKLEEAQDILNKTIDKRKAAEQAGAEATKAAAEAAKQQLADLTTQLEKAQGLAEKGISAKIDIDVSAVTETIKKLDDEIEKRDRLLKIQADVTLAAVTIKNLKDDLEKGVTLNVKANTDTIDAALVRIKEAKPELKIDVDKALEGVQSVIKEAAKIDEIRHQIQTNVDDVRKAIDSLNGRNTESTHTIHVVVDNPTPLPVGPPAPVPGQSSGGLVTGFAGGGPVAAWRLERRVGGEPVQRFARGGRVFRVPSWRKVPGVGERDTVPAALQVGSFVVRKSAARFYGDGLLGRVARFAFGGGVNGRDGAAGAPAQLAFGGGVGPNALKFLLPSVGSDLAKAFQLVPSGAADQNVKYAAQVIAYAREVLSLFSGSGQGQALIRSTGPDIVSRIKYVEEHPKDKDASDQLLKAAAALGANVHLIDLVGRTTSFGAPEAQPFSFEEFLSKYGLPKLFARGGAAPARTGAPPASSDTVPAMLTPGEWVMRPRAVRHFGSHLMHAINEMRIPRAALAAFLTTGFAQPAVAHYATGGPVGVSLSAAETSSSLTPERAARNAAGITAPAPVVFNIYTQKLDEKSFRRDVVPLMDKLQRRRGRD
jgi:TP901 family phage tail tape measure protein